MSLAPLWYVAPTKRVHRKPTALAEGFATSFAVRSPVIPAASRTRAGTTCVRSRLAVKKVSGHTPLTEPVSPIHFLELGIPMLTSVLDRPEGCARPRQRMGNVMSRYEMGVADGRWRDQG